MFMPFSVYLNLLTVGLLDKADATIEETVITSVVIVTALLVSLGVPLSMVCISTSNWRWKIIGASCVLVTWIFIQFIAILVLGVVAVMRDGLSGIQ